VLQEIGMPRFALAPGPVLFTACPAADSHAQTGPDGIVRGVTAPDNDFDAAGGEHADRLGKAEAGAATGMSAAAACAPHLTLV
jgi:hypothetical protein